MEYLVMFFPGKRMLNIGDYIQSIAAMRLLPSKSHYSLINRERLDTYDGPVAKCIMNGWFMEEPEHFPPSDKIIPLFISFHLSPSVANIVLTDNTIRYIKNHGPVGCRDLYTFEKLQTLGIDSYFSACLTLTLGGGTNKRKNSGAIYIVDPCMPCPATGKRKRYKKIMQIAIFSFFYFLTIIKISRQYKKTSNIKIDSRHPFRYSAELWYNYHRVIDRRVLYNAEYLSHSIPQEYFSSEEEKWQYAHELLEKYESAHLVITSRIHCALPCLAYGTPVFFTCTENGESTRSKGRLGGLLDLFNIIYVRTGNASIGRGKVKRISKSCKYTNPDTYVNYAKDLEQRCKMFF